MWIREALRQPPRGGWAMTIAAWVRTLMLALAAVCAGAGVDAALVWSEDNPPVFWWILAVGFVVVAALAGAVAEGLPGVIQGREERTWRSRVMRAWLSDTVRMPDGAAAGGRGGAGAHPGQKPSGPPGTAVPAHSGKHPGGGHPGSKSGGHPGGKPGASPDGVIIDAATEGVEKTAFYRAVFLSPTLASFTAPGLVLLVWIALLDPLSGVILLPFLMLVPVLISVVGKRLRRPNHEYRRRQAEAAGSYLEMIDGMGTLTVLGAIDTARNAFARSARDVMTTISRLLARNQITIMVNDAVFGLVMSGAAIALILWRLAEGAISPGAAFAAMLLTVLLAEPIDRLGRSFYIGLAGRARRDGLEELLPADAGEPSDPKVTAPRRAPDSPGNASATRPTSSGTQPRVPTSPPDLRLCGVSVRKGGTVILDRVDLDVPAGTHLVLVGPTGAGKTTLARVLAGLEDASGEVIVDGTARALPDRRAISTVISQRAGIFSTTIAQNLSVVAPDASREELAAACARAHLDLSVFPLGLDTPVGEQGALLSGGQRRRLVIARALLRDRPLLILDEPTADLDRRTEAQVRHTLTDLAANRTVVHVAHRLSMIEGADLVAVMREGTIVEVGTPADLTQRPGFVRDALTAEGAQS